MTRRDDVAAALSLVGLTAIAIGRVWPDRDDDHEPVTVEIE